MKCFLRFVHLFCFLYFYRVHFSNAMRVTPTQVHFVSRKGQPLTFLGSYLMFERADNALDVPLSFSFL